MTTIFDTIPTGGHLLDSAQGLNGEYAIAIQDVLIAAIFPESTALQAARQFDVSGRHVIPGMIDTHAHVIQHVTGRFGLDADLCGVNSGVTTLIDRGGPSCMTPPAFQEFVVKPKSSRVFDFWKLFRSFP